MLRFCLYREYGPRVIITMLGHSRRVTGQLLDVDSIKENTAVLRYKKYTRLHNLVDRNTTNF